MVSAAGVVDVPQLRRELLELVDGESCQRGALLLLLLLLNLLQLLQLLQLLELLDLLKLLNSRWNRRRGARYGEARLDLA